LAALYSVPLIFGEACDRSDPTAAVDTEIPGATGDTASPVTDTATESLPILRWSGGATLPAGHVLGGEVTGDYVGYMAAIAGDATGDGRRDLLVGSAARSGGEAISGTVYVVPGPIDADRSLATESIALYGVEQPGEATPSVAWLGDLDGDGWGELAIGEPGETTPGFVHIVRGPIVASASLDEVGEEWTGVASGDGAGVDVAAAGDVTGDGLRDLVVGAYRVAGTFTSDAGAAYVLAGPSTGPGSLAGAACRITGDVTSLLLGTAVTGGADLDGDGVSDLLVGSDTDGGEDWGGVYVFRGPLAGDVVASDADARLYGHASWNRPGRFRGTIATGDLDGDGRDDVAVGDHHDGETPGDDRGGVYVVLGEHAAGDLDLATATAIVSGVATDESAGATVGAIGDTDGDGVGELLVGAPGAQPAGFGSGRVSLHYGPWSGSVTIADDAAAWWDGAGLAWWVGYGLAGGLDVSGDAGPDLVLGARGADGDEVDSGAIYVVPGAF
jgi:hypothetical protein